MLILRNLLFYHTGRMRRLCSGSSIHFAQNQRHFSVHEYSAKHLLRSAGCNVEKGVMCESVADIPKVWKDIPSEVKVVKAQILAGGRGKGTFTSGFEGGVHMCTTLESAIEVATKMLGGTLVTKQTGASGMQVRKLYIAECLPEIKKEYYLAILLDRPSGGPVFVASSEGGMDIEEVARSSPEKIHKMPVNILKGISLDATKEFAFALGMGPGAAEELVKLYDFAKSKDALMVEINPFAQLNDGSFMCIDAKINFDDNADFRQAEVMLHEDMDAKDPREVEAAKWKLNYVALDGNVGCLVNGAGLAMATMDVISLYGGSPANFLDVGGSASTQQVASALSIIQQDRKVRGVLVNIFGGIMKCDTIARGVIEACHASSCKVPLVVRLSGTNSDEGKNLLRESGLSIHPASDLDEAAQKMMSLISSK